LKVRTISQSRMCQNIGHRQGIGSARAIVRTNPPFRWDARPRREGHQQRRHVRGLCFAVHDARHGGRRLVGGEVLVPAQRLEQVREHVSAPGN
jgi:hypothetical protein